MNAALPLFAAPAAQDRPANLLAAARALAPHLSHGPALERRVVSAVTPPAFKTAR